MSPIDVYSPYNAEPSTPGNFYRPHLYTSPHLELNCFKVEYIYYNSVGIFGKRKKYYHVYARVNGISVLEMRK